jgi:class 3 adenylate cyclase/ligand-binding sensor domain-containing protein
VREALDMMRNEGRLISLYCHLSFINTMLLRKISFVIFSIIIILGINSCTDKNTFPSTENEAQIWKTPSKSSMVHPFSGDSLKTFMIKEDTLETGKFISIDPVIRENKPPEVYRISKPKEVGYINGQILNKAPINLGPQKQLSLPFKTSSSPIHLDFRPDTFFLIDKYPVRIDGEPTILPMRKRQINFQSGLMKEKTRCVIQDSNGLIWYADQSLTSFDGNEIRVYKRPNVGASYSVDNRLFLDTKKRLCQISNWRAKLSRFDGMNMESADVRNTRILCSNKMGQLCLRVDSSIFLLQDDTMQPIFTHKAAAMHIYDALQDGNKNYWFSGRGGRLLQLSEGSAFLYTFQETGNIRSIQEGEDGILWLGCTNGLFQLRNGNLINLTDQNTKENDGIRELLVDSRGLLWINYVNGKIAVRNSLGTIVEEEQLKYDSRRKLFYEDDRGQIWVSTFNRGFFLFDEYFISTLTLDKLHDPTLNDLILDSKNRVWAASSQGIYCYYLNSGRVLLYDSIPGYNSQLSLITLVADGENIWLSSDYNRYLAKLSEDTIFTYGPEQGMHISASDMVIDKDGELWLGGSQGLYSFDGKKFKNRFPFIKGHVNDLALDKSGNVVISHSIGTVRFNGTQFQFLSQNEGYTWPWVAGTPTRNSLITGGWGNGCTYSEDSIFVKLNVSNGLGNDFVSSLALDSLGTIWVMTENGLNAIKTSELHEYIHNNTNNLNIDWFTKKDGLENTHFKSDIDDISLGDEILFSNGTRILKVNSKKYLEKKIPKGLTITDLLINDKRYHFNSERSYEGIKYTRSYNHFDIPNGLVLKSYLNHVRFQFSSIELIEPHFVKYSYRIKEVSSVWSTPSTENIAEFRNLPSGNLTFELKASIGNDHWTPILKYSLKILPPWYKTWWAYVLYLISLIVAILLLIRWRTRKIQKDKIKLEEVVKIRTAEVVEEKKKSDDLLLNILPQQIAEELKEKGKTKAQNHENVSILFTDFKDFTATSEKLDAEKLVHSINEYFEEFDKIMDKYDIEKIKTIGDAYMAAGGLSSSSQQSASNTVLAALEMQNFISKLKENKKKIGHHNFEMRLGIHTGPVVAGIVGVKKFQYDVWGDTVNIASRMESSGEVGRVNISKSTYELVKDHPDFSFDHRGEIEVKGKGELDMYFVNMNE